MSQFVISNAPTAITEELVSLNIADVLYEIKEMATIRGEEREVTRRRSHFEVVGARLLDNGDISATFQLNLTATIGIQNSKGGNKFAKGHFSISQDMPGYKALLKYAETFAGARYRGGVLQFDPGVVSYYMLPVVGEQGYFTFDVLDAGDVDIDNNVETQHLVADLWFEGVSFESPLGNGLDVQKPVKRQNPLVVKHVAPAAPAPAARPVRQAIQIPAAIG